MSLKLKILISDLNHKTLHLTKKKKKRVQQLLISQLGVIEQEAIIS